MQTFRLGPLSALYQVILRVRSQSRRPPSPIRLCSFDWAGDHVKPSIQVFCSLVVPTASCRWEKSLTRNHSSQSGFLIDRTVQLWAVCSSELEHRRSCSIYPTICGCVWRVSDQKPSVTCHSPLRRTPSLRTELDRQTWGKGAWGIP